MRRIIVKEYASIKSFYFYIIENNKKAMKTFAYGLLIIYAVVLPFNLFFPVTNVYTYYQLGSTLEYTIPTIEQFFYKTTTYNNSFPSLHVALSLLLVRCATLTKNKRFQYFSYCCAGAVIVSVIYLAIHWITDVIGGIILTSTALFRPQLFSAGG